MSDEKQIQIIKDISFLYEKNMNYYIFKSIMKSIKYIFK